MHRAVTGIQVESSYAFAAISEEGSTITEGVWWPKIPVDVVRNAVALKQSIDAQGSDAPFLRDLKTRHPDQASYDGDVRIVHSGPTFGGAFEARAVYSVFVQGAERPRTERYDAVTGETYKLPDEIALQGMKTKTTPTKTHP
jgi:hypothetical protein